jgi:hypothetical protein
LTGHLDPEAVRRDAKGCWPPVDRPPVKAPPLPPPASVHINVSPIVSEEVNRLAEMMRVDAATVYKLALSILKIALDESRNGSKLVLMDRDGRARREFVLPPPASD